MSSISEAARPLIVFLKSHIRTYQRRTKNGGMATVQEHEDSRMAHRDMPAAGRGHNGGPPMAEPRRSPPAHDAARIPTRLIGEAAAKKAGVDRNSHEHTIGPEEMRKNQKLWEHNVGLLRHYPGTPEHMKEASADALAEHTINRWKENLLWLHDQVPEETRQRSKLWYDGARAITDRWAGEYGLHPASIAGALAALSPQKDWYQNVSFAKRVIEVTQTKQDHRWDEAMTKRVGEIEAMAKYPEVIKAVEGKTYGELTDGLHKAFWIRAYDETHNPRTYPIISPEGNEMGLAQKKNAGKDGKVEDRAAGWGSLVEIRKAVESIEANGDLTKISPLMGEEHKVRNFYNNIVAPHSANGEVTMDTHAVAAAELRPLSGNSEAVIHNFGSSMAAKKQEKFKQETGRDFVNAKSDASGVSGTYGLAAEAYRRAAKERGILPREMQSITWEAVRGLFEDTFKKGGNQAKIDAIWKQHAAGKISIHDARKQIHDFAGGITPPTWHPDHPSNRGAAGGAERPAGGGKADAPVDGAAQGSADAGSVRGAKLGRRKAA